MSGDDDLTKPNFKGIVDSKVASEDGDVSAAARKFIADTRESGGRSLQNTPPILEEFKSRVTDDKVKGEIDALLGELRAKGAGKKRKTRKRSKKSRKATRRRR